MSVCVSLHFCNELRHQKSRSKVMLQQDTLLTSMLLATTLCPFTSQRSSIYSISSSSELQEFKEQEEQRTVATSVPGQYRQPPSWAHAACANWVSGALPVCLHLAAITTALHPVALPSCQQSVVNINEKALHVENLQCNKEADWASTLTAWTALPGQQRFNGITCGRSGDSEMSSIASNL